MLPQLPIKRQYLDIVGLVCFLKNDNQIRTDKLTKL